MTEEKTMWGVWCDTTNEVAICDTKEHAIEEIKDGLYENHRYDLESDYYLVQIKKIERFYLPERPEIKREMV